MTTIFDLLQHRSIAALAWTLIHFVWQGALIGGGAFLILRTVRPQRPSIRYAIGVATLAAMVITCATTFAIEMRSQSTAAIVPSTASAAFAPAVATSPAARQPISDRTAISMAGAVTALPSAWPIDPLEARALPLIVTAWLTGVLAMSVRLVGGWLLTRRMARRAAVAVSPAIQAAACAIAARLQVRRAVAILESQLVAVPTLIGWLKPVVLLPTAALVGLSPDQLRAILAHELAHVRRHDYLVNLLQSMVETLLFYHPATWWVSAQVRSEREHCCDDLAVEVCGDRLVYASALAELTTMAGHRGLALAATDGSLLNRVQRILGGQRSMHEPAPAWPLLALVVLVVGAGSFSASVSARKASSELRQDLAGAAFGREGGRTADPSPQATPTPPASAAAVTAASTMVPAAQAVGRAPAEQRPIAAEDAQADAERARLREQQERLAAELQELDRLRRLTEEKLHRAITSAQLQREEAQLRAAIAAAPPSPPLPSEPPAPPPSQEAGMRGSGNMSWSDNGESISVRWTGAFRLNDDETDIEWIENGATVTVTDGMILRSRVDLRGTANGIERSYSRNGLRRDYEPEGRAFLTAAIDRLIRQSGAFAKDRVARFLKRGGPDAVLAQIDRLSESSYVRRVYYSELLKQAPATDALLGKVLDRVTRELSSNYDKATLFTQAAALPAITDSHRVSIARAVKSISSSYDQRRSLIAILNATPLAATVAAAVVDAVASISSNHDRAEVLIAVAEHGGVTAATAPAFMERVRTTSSSHDQRRVLTAAAAHATLTDVVGVEMARAIGAITSSHDQSSMLITFVDRGGLTDSNAQAFFDSAARVSSSHDMSRVLRKVVERSPNSERLINGVLTLAPRVSSSYDRAGVLIDVAARSRVTGDTRQLYIAATSGLSNHDETRVLAALVRAEGRR
jgi:beta-lactamase regulating signal transducer with metallopeptidase domain